jgi:hypothetical protein
MAVEKTSAKRAVEEGKEAIFSKAHASPEEERWQMRVRPIVAVPV